MSKDKSFGNPNARKRLADRINELESAKADLDATTPTDPWGQDQKQRLQDSIDERLKVLKKEKALRDAYRKDKDPKKRARLLKQYRALKKTNPTFYSKGKVADPCASCVQDKVDQLGKFYTDGHTEYTVEEYEQYMQEKLGRPMTSGEKDNLAAGCIGITAVNLDPSSLRPNPPLNKCYGSLKDALREWRDEKKKTGKAPVLFSKRFWSSGNSYSPDPVTGKVDMSGYNYETRPGPRYTNFDYGYYDPETQSWWHANHSQPGMTVYRSTRSYYSRPLGDFDKQVYCLGPAR